jgi:hypothetical protein
MRPIIRTENGIVRFKANRLVSRLLDESQKRGFGLNELARVESSQEEQEEFAQLIGYSLCGYHELSYVSDLSCFEASKVAKAKFGEKVGGCRDTGCEIHCGIEREGRR